MRKLKRTALPRRVTSKNPVVILKHVIRAIQQEPKRYDQSEVVMTNHWDDEPDPKDTYYPSCGTVACVGGWVNLLTGATKHNQDDLMRAGYKLKLTPEEQNFLFDGSPADVRKRWTVTPRQHAADGVKHIKRFVLKKWGVRI